MKPLSQLGLSLARRHAGLWRGSSTAFRRKRCPRRAEVDWRLLAPRHGRDGIRALLLGCRLPADAYRVDDNHWSYWRSLHLRGLSYLFGSLHYELGQAALAWNGLAHRIRPWCGCFLVACCSHITILSSPV